MTVQIRQIRPSDYQPVISASHDGLYSVGSCQVNAV
jgi:hypothetical protein